MGLEGKRKTQGLSKPTVQGITQRTMWEFFDFLRSKSTSPGGDDVKELKLKLERLEAADAARKEAEKTMGERQDRHLKTVSLIVAVPGGIIAITGILMVIFGRLAQTDSRETTREMRADINNAISQMHSNFDRLAGDALKQPKLEILHQGAPLDGRKFETDSDSPIYLQLSFKNTGQKKTEELRVRVFTSERVTVFGWEEVETSEDSLRFRYSPPSYQKMLDSIPTGDTAIWSGTIDVWAPELKTNITCRLRAFYGVQPADVYFIISPRPSNPKP